MKKIIVLILSIFTFFGCGEDLEFNTPSFQAKKDGNLWEAVSYTASIDNTGVLTVIGSNNLETITLVIDNTQLGFHDILETISSATLLDINAIEFSTDNLPDPSVQLYPAGGLIELKEVNLEAGYVSGAFSFDAYNTSGLTAVNFNEGVFFKIPLVSAPVATIDTNFIPDDIALNIMAVKSLNLFALMPGDSQLHLRLKECMW